MSDGERSEGGWSWPVRCPRCKAAVLPFSDYGQEGAPVMLKAWACIESACAYALRIDKGKVSYSERRGDDDELAKRRSNER